MRLRTILDPGCVVLDVGTGSKRDILARLVTPVISARPDLDGPALLDELARREDESSTAIADGIAIPHARPDVREVTAGFGRSLQGVDFQSLDGKPTRLLLLLLSPASNSSLHVSWLSHIARVLADPATRSRLLEAETRERILEIFEERESEIDHPERTAAKDAS